MKKTRKTNRKATPALMPSHPIFQTTKTLYSPEFNEGDVVDVFGTKVRIVAVEKIETTLAVRGLIGYTNLITGRNLTESGRVGGKVYQFRSEAPMSTMAVADYKVIE